MIRQYKYLIRYTVLLMCAFLTPGTAKAETAQTASYDQVASEEETAKANEVGVEGMYPIYGTDIVEGVYQVEVESSSSMFRVENAILTVEDGKLSAVLTLSGTGYLKLFMGTGEEAADSPASEYIGYKEVAGKYTYTIPVEALDLPIDCAAFSRKKEKWYDRKLLFQAGSLPPGAVQKELPDYEELKRAAKQRRIAAMKAEQETEEETQAQIVPAAVELEEGEYAIEFEFSGGTGRTSLQSPATLIVKNCQAYARIVWNSPNYDYMKIGQEKYLPVNMEGNSVFEIPIPVFDEEILVIGDTTAMSTPHEIEYQLKFLLDTVKPKEKSRPMFLVIMGGSVLTVLAVLAVVKKRKQI